MPCARDRREREMAIGVAADNQGALMARQTKRPGSGHHADRILIFGRSPHRDEPDTAVRQGGEEKLAADSFAGNHGEQRAGRQDREDAAD